MGLTATGGVFTATVNLAAAEENYTVVAGEEGRRIRVLAAYLHSRLGAEVNFHEGGASISGPLVFAPNLERSLAPANFGWFETSEDNGLLLNTTNDLHGLVRYQVILAG